MEIRIRQLLSLLFFGPIVREQSPTFFGETDEVVVLVDRVTKERTYLLVRLDTRYPVHYWFVVRKIGKAEIKINRLAARLILNPWEDISIILKSLGYPGVYELYQEKNNFMLSDLIDALCPSPEVLQEKFDYLPLREKFSCGGLYETEEFGVNPEHWEEVAELLKKEIYGKEVYF